MRRLQLAFGIIVCLAFSGLLPSGLSQAELDFTLEHKTSLDSLGRVLVEETLVVRNTGPTAASLPGYELRFAPSYGGLIAAIATDGPAGARTSVDTRRDFTPARVDFAEPELISPGGTATYRLRLYLTGALMRINATHVQLTLTTLPAGNLILTAVNSTISLPESVRLVDRIANFTAIGDGQRETWQGTFATVAPEGVRAAEVLVDVGDAADFTIVSFDETRRELVVTAEATVRVREFVHLTNNGDNALARLDLAPLGGPPRSITLLPIGEPPLANPTEVFLEGRTLNLLSALKASVAAGGTLLLAYEYSLLDSTLRDGDGIFRIRAPLAPPVPGLVRMHTLTLSLPPGFISVGDLTPLRRANASELSAETYDLSYRPGFAWGATDLLPAGSTVFLVTLLGVLLTDSARRGRAVREGPRELGELGRVFDERLETTAELLTSLRSRTPKELSRRELEAARRTAEELRSRALTRVGEVRARLPPTRPELHRALAEVVSAERECDRAARELLTLFEQRSLGRVKEETFERLVLEHTRRYEQWAGRVAEAISLIEREPW
jgi:hypothetical protein